MYGIESGTMPYIYMCGLKVEPGEKVTEWVPAQEDAEGMSDNVNSAYSWNFSPTAGIKMWKGAQVADQEIFKIDNNGLYI
jgi:hypothetical protein